MPARHHRALIAAIAVFGLAIASLSATVGAQTPEPYRDPPFTCEIHDYGTEPPPIPGPDDDPRCVRYDKTNVTVSTLEAVDFLAAEPGRVTIVAGACSFWQQDEWAIRATPDSPALVAWSGSYWYDAVSGSAAGVLRDLRVGDQPATADDFIEAIRPLVGDDQADEFALFTDDGGGGGLTMALPEGFGYEACRGDGGADDGETPAPDGGEEPATEQPTARSVDAAEPAAGVLPATGATSGVWFGLIIAVMALLLRCGRAPQTN